MGAVRTAIAVLDRDLRVVAANEAFAGAELALCGRARERLAAMIAGGVELCRFELDSVNVEAQLVRIDQGADHILVAFEPTADQSGSHEFLARLGHGLRNPLAALIQGFELLRLQEDDPALRQRIGEMISRQANQMLGMIDQLQELARLGCGTVELEQAPVDLGAVARSAVEAVMPMIDGRRQTLSVAVAERSDLCVLGDAARLTQALECLLRDAADCTAEGGAIELEVEAVGDQIEARVRDTGAAIDPELLPQIFEVFVRHTRKRQHHTASLGFDLPLVARLIDLHGGTVEANSTGERGAEVVITLPRLRSRPATPP